jgi:polar amino acid transport system permease protein
MLHTLDFYYVVRAWPQFLAGLWVTLELTIWANAIGLTAGFLLALLLVSRIAPVRWLVVTYIEFFRCTPALIQIVWFFFCVPILFNVFWQPVTLGLLVLGMNLTAFNAEAYRAAIQAIPSSQYDASVALGLSRWTQTVDVVLPQAARLAVPVLITNAIGIFQQSSLVALVGVTDLMYQAKLLSTKTYRPIETYTFVALIYLALAVPFGRIAAFLESRSERLR